MGDKALTCFLGCCVQLLQVLMEVFVQKGSLSKLLSFRRRNGGWFFFKPQAP